MKALLQRVSRASVSTNGEIVGRIGRGLVVLVGVMSGDSEEDVRYLVKKTGGLRIFPDAAEKFNLSALDIGGGALDCEPVHSPCRCQKGATPRFYPSGTAGCGGKTF